MDISAWVGDAATRLSTKRAVRLLLAGNILLALVFVGVSAAAYQPDIPAGDVDSENGTVTDRSSIAARPNLTVVTTQNNGHGLFEDSELVAIRPNGSLLHRSTDYHTYFDVDPIEGTGATVLYVASHRLRGAACTDVQYCFRNYIVRENLSTGASTVLHTRIGQQRWHDVDRLTDTHVLIADIYLDRIRIVNHDTGIITWAWSAQEHYATANGGPYPADWTHLNDVEQLPDGRLLVSLKNQKQVVFVDRQTGLQEEWTLGAERTPQVLDGVHNPDYLPADRGGPAIVAADSQNNRVVEYQRTADGWNRTWVWTDARMAWPRDADRLPNGHTLIADSNGDRIIEVDRQGEIVWTLQIRTPYEVERFETGDESAGGESARRLGLASHGQSPDAAGQTTTNATSTPANATAGPTINGHRLTYYYNTALFVLPPWFRLPEGVAVLWVIGLGLAWGSVELRWRLRGWSVREFVRALRVQRPIVLDDEGEN